MISPNTATSIVTAVTGTTATSTLAMVAGGFYMLSSTTNCWIIQGSGTLTAAVNTSGNVYLPAGQVLVLNGVAGTSFAVIEDSAGGHISACRLFNY